MSLLVNQLGEALAAMKERAERAEAQVQAVRRLADTPVSPEWRGAYNDLAPDAWSAGYVTAIRSILRILDGGDA